MTIELSPEEKIGIINSHIKNVAYNKYNLEISLIQENAKTVKDQTIISRITADLAETELQIIALNAELENISS